MTIDGRECFEHTMDGAKILMLQPVDDHDRGLLDDEVAMIKDNTEKPFNLVAFAVGNWMDDLTPWTAPPAFGKQPFGSGAHETLRFINDILLPSLTERWGKMTVVVGGYSLAGLFSLWAGYNSNLFDGIAAASPSVWYPGWMDYIESREMHARAVYLSLGDRESHTKNPVMAHINDAIRRQYELLRTSDRTAAIEWNPGNHFVDSEKRMARAFAWVASRII